MRLENLLVAYYSQQSNVRAHLHLALLYCVTPSYKHREECVEEICGPLSFVARKIRLSWLWMHAIASPDAPRSTYILLIHSFLTFLIWITQDIFIVDRDIQISGIYLYMVFCLPVSPLRNCVPEARLCAGSYYIQRTDIFFIFCVPSYSLLMSHRMSLFLAAYRAIVPAHLLRQKCELFWPF